MKKHSTEWEKIIVNYIPDEGPVYRKYKELL